MSHARMMGFAWGALAGYSAAYAIGTGQTWYLAFAAFAAFANVIAAKTVD